VIETSKHKAVEVMESLISKDNTSPKFVIGTDTVVVIDGKILEKPADHDAAYQMLKSLNKSHHQVYSGVTLLKYDCEKDVRMRQFYECTDVMLGDIPDNVIRVYANSIEPLDKAGGYGIQDVGGSLVERINGCYFNVQGFPLFKFCLETAEFLKPV